MNLPVAISEEVQSQWDQFVSATSPADTILASEDSIKRFWQQSAFIMRLCKKHPDWLESLLQDNPTNIVGHLCEQTGKNLSHDISEDEFKQALRQLRQRAHLHICWNDLIEQQDIFFILSQLSHLADGCMKLSADWQRHRLVDKYGEPRNEQGDIVHLVVIAMGKLGGDELNFSSDIDIMFSYSDTGSTDGELSISNQEFFTHLAQSVINSLSEMTVDGFVYRVDCRLRPFGDSGPLVVNFNHVEDYLHTHGREWERYAYLKARVMYGLEQDLLQFDQMASSFVYRKYIDFGVIHTLREMKDLISRQIVRKGSAEHIKLGFGGIREIEFIVQFFQLVHGGRNRAMQTRKIVEGLEEIRKAGYLNNDEVTALLNAYKFLRRVENRLQMYDDMQTHVLPDQSRLRLTLAQSMGFEDIEHFERELQNQRDAVNQVFVKIHGDTADPHEQGDFDVLWDRLTSQSEEFSLDEFNIKEFNDLEYVVNKLRLLINSPAYRNQDHEGRLRLRNFIPKFLQQIKKTDCPALVVDRLFLLLQSILRRSVYLVLLNENEEALKQLIAVVSSSPWIAKHITSYPLLLDELVARSEHDYLLTKDEISRQFKEEILAHEELEYESVLERVRLFKHARELRVACADVLGKIPIMKVSDQLSWTAEVVVDGCVKYLERQFDPAMKDNLAVIALGKLGGIELSYGSDLDLMYICKNEKDSGYGVENKIPYVVKITKFAQRLTQMLALQTVSGKLYDIDMRLRPDGESGPLVPHFSFVESYYQTRAWTWELQALVRARCIAGSPEFKRQFQHMRQAILCQPRDPRALAQEVVNMRAKMLDSKASHTEGIFHLKNDQGGITDIEFMVQYAILAHAHKDMDLCEYSDNVRLLERLADHGFVPTAMAREITEIYCQFRNVMHRIALQAGEPEVSDNQYQAQRKVVRKYWKTMLGEY